MTISLEYINKRYPTEKSALELLELAIWGNGQKCPYCGSSEYSVLKGTKRYHCNTCNTSYSVTVNTIFHRTKVDIQKWVYLLDILSSGEAIPSLRKLSEKMNVTKDTVSKMIKTIKLNYIEHKESIQIILNLVNNGRQ